jgi:hypothetical protein
MRSGGSATDSNPIPQGGLLDALREAIFGAER